MAGIRFMFSILPAVLAVMGAAAIIFYRINKNTIEEIERDLSARHEPA